VAFLVSLPKWTTTKILSKLETMAYIRKSPEGKAKQENSRGFVGHVEKRNFNGDSTPVFRKWIPRWRNWADAQKRCVKSTPTLCFLIHRRYYFFLPSRS
jgi:hypothetical protein